MGKKRRARFEDSGYRLAYRWHGIEPPSANERDSRLIGEAGAGKPDWATSVRLFAANFATMQTALRTYLAALEEGRERSARMAATDVRKTTDRGIELARAVPLAESAACVQALERLA